MIQIFGLDACIEKECFIIKMYTVGKKSKSWQTFIDNKIQNIKSRNFTNFKAQKIQAQAPTKFQSR